MCGIVGITSSKEVTSRIIRSLKKLEYRGYDSAGIASVSGGTLQVTKSQGKLVNLIEKKALLLCKSMIEYMYNERGDQNGKFKRTY